MCYGDDRGDIGRDFIFQSPLLIVNIIFTYTVNAIKCKGISRRQRHWANNESGPFYFPITFVDCPYYFYLV